MNQQESIFVAMRQQIAAAPMSVTQPAARRPRVMSRARLALGGAGALAAAAAVALVTGIFANTPPAFAITITTYGVVIRLNEFSALSSLNAKLTAKGIPLSVVPAVRGCTATATIVGANGSVHPPQTLLAGHASGPIGAIGIQHLHRPAPGDTFVIAISRDHRSASALPREIRRPVPRCVGEQPARSPKSLRGR
jgi:hypothetical protein